MIALLLAAVFQCPDGTPPPCTRPVRGGPAPAALSVAILTFENRSRDTSDAWLAEGLADEIASRLGQVGRLSVTSRAMVRRTRDAGTTPLPQLGRTLNTSYLVTGTVQGTSQRLRVSVELLRAANGVQAWTETYDRSRTDLLAIQADIATAVAGAITGRLLPQERATLERRPTSNPAAYEQYLRAAVLYRSGNTPAVALRVVEQLERVVAIDSAFLQAWTMLAEANGFGWWSYGDRSESRRSRWRTATERAVALAPDAPETRIAQGYWYYWSLRDYATARRHFEAALARDSMRAEVWGALSNLERRQGQWAASVEHRARGLALEPDNVSESINLMQTLHLLRRLDDAETWYQRALARAPQSAELWLNSAFNSMLRGDTVESRTRFDRAFALGGEELMYQSGFGVPFVVDIGTHVIPRLSAPANTTERHTLHALRMRRYDLLGHTDSARSVAAELRVYQERLLAQRPDDWGYLGPLALTLAVLGDTAAARASADRGVAQMPVTLDAFDGSTALWWRVEALVRIGDHEGAVRQLRDLLAIPSFLTVDWMRTMKFLAPLRGRPDFQALLR